MRRSWPTHCAEGLADGRLVLPRTTHLAPGHASHTLVLALPALLAGRLAGEIGGTTRIARLALELSNRVGSTTNGASFTLLASERAAVVAFSAGRAGSHAFLTLEITRRTEVASQGALCAGGFTRFTSHADGQARAWAVITTTAGVAHAETRAISEVADFAINATALAFRVHVGAERTLLALHRPRN